MMLVRYLHTTLTRYGRLKQSLDTFTRMNIVKPPLSKKELKYREEKAKRYERAQAAKPLTKATAKSVIEKKLDIELHELTPETQFSEEQLAQLFKNPNKRLIYSFLGISGEQLKDADIVNKDVKKFLSRDEVSKAIYVCKLARKKGVVAMNEVMTYLLAKGRLDEALSLYQYRKKWGIEPNEYTYSILFEGLSNQKQPISAKMSASIIKILEKLREKDEVSVIHLSTALKALFNSKEPLKAIELFESLSKKDGLDNKIFSVYLFGLCDVNNSDTFVVKAADACFSKALRVLEWRQIDSQLISAYSLCYLKRQNLKYVSRSINIMRAWFKICNEDMITQKIRFTEPHDYRFQKIEPIVPDLIELKDLNPFGKRLPLNNYVLDVYICALQRLGLFRKGVEVFDQYSLKVKVDLTLFNDYLKSVVKLKPVIEDMTEFDDNKLIKNLVKMKDFQVKPTYETNIILFKFLDAKFKLFSTNQDDEVVKRQNSILFISFLKRLANLLVELQGNELSTNLSADFVQLFIRVQSQVPFDEQVQFLNDIYFKKLQNYKLLNKLSDDRSVKRIRSFEIGVLSSLKILISSLQSDPQRQEVVWSSINRIKNAVQSHVYYLGSLQSIEDPGYSRLEEIEDEMVLSVKSYNALVLKQL